MYIKDGKSDDKKGSQYWGGDRMERMLREKNLENELDGLLLMKYLPAGLTSVADLGCGIGRRHIYFPGMNYVGFDREEIMIENGNKEFPHLDLRLCDLMELNEKFPDLNGFFDLVFTFHVVQYNYPAQQKEIFNNIYNILKPGGYYYMKENENDCPRSSVPDTFIQIAAADGGHTIFRKN